MITFEEFAQIIVARVEELAEGRIQVRIDEILKNNGLKLLGLAAAREDTNISPIIYLDKFYADYKNGGSISMKNCSKKESIWCF